MSGNNPLEDFLNTMGAKGNNNWFSEYTKQLNLGGGNPKNQPGNTNGLSMITRPAFGVNYEQMPAQLVGANAGAQTGQGQQDFVRKTMMQLLASIQSNQPQGMSAQDILSQANHQVSMQFDPQIAAIQREMGRTKKRAGANKGELTHLYGALADSYGPDTVTSKKQYESATKAAKAQQKELQGQIGKTYSDDLQQQTDAFGNLGISDALGQTTKQQKTDLDYLSKLNATEGQSQLDALSQQGNADITYNREGAGIARAEGAGAVTDLMTQLNDYLSQKGGDVATLQGQRKSSLQVLQDQLRQQSAKATQDYNQTAWGQLFQLMGFQNTLNQQGQQGQQQKTPTTGLLGANQSFADFFGNTQQAKDMSGRFQELLQQKPFREGRIKSGPDYIKLSPEQAASFAASYADDQQMSQQEKLSLIQAVYAYYGRMGG